MKLFLFDFFKGNSSPIALTKINGNGNILHFLNANLRVTLLNKNKF